MIKYIVSEKYRRVTAKFVSNEAKDTNRTIWLKYIVDGIYKSIKECKECSNIYLADKIVIVLDDYIAEVQGKEEWSKDNMNNNNYATKQDKEKKQLVFDNIKIEVKDFVVSITVSDGRNAYVYRVKCEDYSPESLYKAIMESIRFAKNIMKHRFPMYNDLYYTVDFASNDLVSAGKWRACTKEIILRDNCLIFKTKDEAVAVAKKMLETVSEQKKGQHNGQ